MKLNRIRIAAFASVAGISLLTGLASAAPGSERMSQSKATDSKMAPAASDAKQEAPVQAGEGKGGDTTQADRASAAQAIAGTTVTRHGKLFPVFTSGLRDSGPGPCNLYDTQEFTHGAQIDIEGGSHRPTSETWPDPAPQNAVYSPPNPEWVVQSYNRVIDSAGAPYTASDSGMPAGYTFSSSASYSAVNSTMQSYVLSLNIPDYIKADLNAQISTMMSNIASYAYSVSASHGTVQHTAYVTGAGRYNVNVGHAWYHGWINGSLVCAPAYLHDPNALTTKMKAWVNTTVSHMRFAVMEQWHGRPIPRH